MTSPSNNLMPMAAWKVTIDGKDVTDKIKPRLISLTLTEKRGGEADEIELKLDATDGKLAMPKKGVRIRVFMGWLQGAGLPIGLVDKGEFTVDERSKSGPPDVICVRGRSADFTGVFKVRKGRSFVGQTVKTILSAIASDNGLTLNIDADLGAKIVPALGHTAMSDAVLVKTLGGRFDAVATVKAGKLIFSPVGKGASPAGQPFSTVTIDRLQTGVFNFEEPDRGTYAGVEARWHDKATGQTETVVVGGSGEPKAKRLRKTYANEADARDAAEAEDKRMERGKAKMSFPMGFGRPDIFPDRPITLTGWDAEIDGIKWLAAETAHTMGGNGGLTSRLQLESAG